MNKCKCPYYNEDCPKCYPKKFDLEREIYSTRLLLFLETGPQTNEYQQVLLTEDQFKAVSDTISKFVRNGERQEIVKVETSKEKYKLPDLKQIT